MTKKSSNSSERICVLSGRYPVSVFESYPNHKAYCDRHGYTYISCSWPTGAINPYINKMRYIQAYYHLFDFIFWIDDDAFFIDQSQPLDRHMPQSQNFLSICSSPDFKEIFTFISSGQFMLRCDKTGREFIDSVENTDLSVVKSWWTEEMGYYSNGDQDAMVYLLHTDNKFEGYDRHHYKEFNSRVENLLQGESVFLLHITGTEQRKWETYLRTQKYLNCGPTLLAHSDETRMGIGIHMYSSLKEDKHKTMNRCIKKSLRQLSNILGRSFFRKPKS